MIHISRKLLKRPPPCLGKFPRLNFSTKEAAAPAEEEKKAEKDDPYKVPDFQIKKRRKHKTLEPPKSDDIEHHHMDFPKIHPEDLIYSLEEGADDSEFGMIPTLMPNEEHGEPPEEEVLRRARIIPAKSIKVKVENRSANLQRYMLRMAHIIHQRRPQYFHFRAMNRPMSRQLRSFPRYIEEETFELPEDSDGQKKYITALLQKIKRQEGRIFRIPSAKISGLNDSQNKTPKAVIGKSVFRMSKDEQKHDIFQYRKQIERIVFNVNEAFLDRNFEIISVRDFRFLLNNQEFLPNSHIFFNREFFQANTYLIGNLDVEDICKNALKNHDFYKNLEFVQFHKRFLTPGFHQPLRSKGDFYQLIINLKNCTDFDYISFFYHGARVFQIDQSFLLKLDLSVWNRAFTQVYWGAKTEQEKEIFHNQIEKLLYSRFNIESNQSLTLFLIDMIMNGKTYPEAQAAFALTVRILARLVDGSNDIKDLFQLFVTTLSQQSFDFYIRDHLTELLKSSGQYSAASKLKKALEEYEKCRKEDIQKSFYTFFDQQMNDEQHAFISYQHKYEHKSNKLGINLQSMNLLAPMKKEVKVFPEINEKSPHHVAKSFLLNRNYDGLIENIKKDFMDAMLNVHYPVYMNNSATYIELINNFHKIIHDLAKEQPSSEFSDPKKALKLMYDFIKPYRESLDSVQDKDSFDRRFDRWVIRSNDELRKFAEMRENYVYNIVDDEMIRNGKVKRGYHIIRRFGKLIVARMGYKGKMISTTIPLSLYQKKPFIDIRKEESRLRKAKLARRRKFRKVTGPKKKISTSKKMKTVLRYRRAKKEKLEKLRKLEKDRKLAKATALEKLGQNEFRKTSKFVGRFQEKPKASFATLKQVNDLDEDYDIEVQKNDTESGFKVYLQKLKEIEEKKKKEDEQQQKDLNLLSENELDKMKKSLFQEDPLYRSAFTKGDGRKFEPKSKFRYDPKSKFPFENMKDRKGAIAKEQDELFEKIGAFRKKADKPLFEGLKRPTSFGGEEEEEDQEIENEYQDYVQKKQAALPKAETPYVKFWVEKFEDRAYEMKEIVAIVEKNLKENETIKKPLLLALSCVEGFGHTQKDGAAVLEHLLSDKKFKLEPLDRLKVEFVCQAGPSSKDYNNYLKVSSIDYDMPQEAYANLFRYYVGSINYNRKCFKRTMSHLIRYNSEVADETILACIDVIKKQKTGMTLLEYIHLIIKNKVKISTKAAEALLAHFKDYKVLSEDIEGLYRLFLKTYEWDYRMSLIEPYLDMLIIQNKTEIYMAIFEKIKEFLMSRKHTKEAVISPEKVAEETTQKAENATEEKETPKETKENTEMGKKKKEGGEVQEFYMDFIEKLNSHKVFNFSKLVFYDFVNNQFEFKLRDYLVGLKTFSDSGDEFLVLYNQFKASPFFKFDEPVFNLVIDAVNANPTTLSTLFDEILDEYVYTKNYLMNLNNLNSFIIGFGKTQKFFEFTNFLRFLSKNKQELDRTVKLTCYKVLGKVTDDMSKPYIKGLIDAIFDDNDFEKENQQRIQTYKRKAEAKRQKKEATKNQQQEGESKSPSDGSGASMFKKIKLSDESEEIQIPQQKKTEGTPKKEEKVEVSSKKSATKESKGESGPKKEENKVDATAKKEEKKETSEKVEAKPKDSPKEEVKAEKTKEKGKGKKNKNAAKEDKEEKAKVKEEVKAQETKEKEVISSKKSKAKNVLARLEVLDKPQKTRQKKILQSKDTWIRINESIPFSDDEKEI